MKLWQQRNGTSSYPQQVERQAACSHLNGPRRTDRLEAKSGSAPNPGTHLL